MSSQMPIRFFRLFHKHSLPTNSWKLTFNFKRCLSRSSIFSAERGAESSDGSASFDGALLAFLKIKPRQNLNKPRWNRAINEAEKLVGFPNVFHALKSLPGDDIFSIFAEIRKLVGTSHPVIKTAKRLVYDGKNNMQVRGLLVLLIAKLIGFPNENVTQQQIQQLANNHQLLAEQVEMIHTARFVHNSIVNIKSIADAEDKHDAEYGNKVAILLGDYLLASASYKLALLRNLKVLELMTISIRNFVEGEFMFQQDKHGLHYPTQSATVADWETKTFLCSGCLLANGCRGAAILSEHNDHVQAQVYDLGKQLAAAWQAFAEVETFRDDSQIPAGAAFDLTSLPVIIHLQNDPKLLEIISANIQNLDQLDYKKLRAMIESGNGIEEAKKFGHKYTENSLKIVQNFPASDVRTALENLILATSMDN